MSQQEIGQRGESGLHLPAHPVLILHQPLPAILLSEISEIFRASGGAPVSQMVVAAYGEAPGAQLLSEFVIPADMLHHPVADLHHAPGLFLLRRPNAGLDGGLPVRTEKGDFLRLPHAASPPPYLYEPLQIHLLCPATDRFLQRAQPSIDGAGIDGPIHSRAPDSFPPPSCSAVWMSARVQLSSTLSPVSGSLDTPRPLPPASPRLVNSLRSIPSDRNIPQ